MAAYLTCFYVCQTNPLKSTKALAVRPTDTRATNSNSGGSKPRYGNPYALTYRYITNNINYNDTTRESSLKF